MTVIPKVAGAPRHDTTTVSTPPAGSGRRRRPRPGRLAVHFVLAISALVALFPFYVMVVLAFSPVGPISLPRSLVPWPLSTEAFAQIFAADSVGRWALNTMIYAVVSCVLVLVLSSMAGYAFAKKRFVGRNLMFWSFLAMLMVPYQITLIPTFILIAKAGGVDTYWGLILPTLANAQAVFLMRQFIVGIPDELIDAARLDGCSEWRIFTRVVLPLTKPIMATLGIFVFLWHWNDFLWPLLMGQSISMRTLTTGIASLQSEHVPLNVVFAGSVVAFVPIFVAYLVGQRYLAENMMNIGVKG